MAKFKVHVKEIDSKRCWSKEVEADSPQQAEGLVRSTTTEKLIIRKIKVVKS